MQKYYGRELTQCTLQNVVSSTTKEWEVLKDGKEWTNGLHTESECLEEIKRSEVDGHIGKWSYREFINTVSVRKVVEI